MQKRCGRLLGRGCMLQSSLAGDESQPCAVTSLGLSGLFLEKKEGGRGMYQGIMERGGDSPPREQSSSPSPSFGAPRCLQESPAMQTNTNYINVVNPKLNFTKATK